MAFLTLFVSRSCIFTNYSDHVVSSANSRVTIERHHTLCALEIIGDVFQRPYVHIQSFDDYLKREITLLFGAQVEFVT